MQIEIITNNGQGEAILLPPELALDDFDLDIDIPGEVIPGRDGMLTHGHLKRIEPRSIRASGIIKGLDKQEADELAELLRSRLVRKGVLWLKRFEDSDRYIKVECAKINHNYNRGHFSGSLFTMNIQFIANDPFWYNTNFVYAKKSIVFTPPVTMIDIENAGSHYTEPTIWIHGKTSAGSHVLNPKLINYTTGKRIAYEGEVKEDQILILDTKNCTAYLTESNVSHSGVAQGGTNESIQLDAGASTINDYYKDLAIKLSGGTGQGQYKKIIGYNGATRTAIVDAWQINPDSTTQFVIFNYAFAAGYFLSEAQTSKMDKKNSVLANLANLDYLIYGFPLNPGINKIEIEDENELIQEVKMVYTERWT